MIEIQKQKYIFLISIILIGIISGILFIFFITKEDKLLLNNELIKVIDSINNHKINHLKTLVNSLSNNLLTVIGIYIAGISILGIPLIILLLFIKGFVFGFSISSLLNIYHLKGIFLVFSYLFPHHLILLIVYLLIGFYSISFSIKLFRYLFLKENIILIKYFKKLNKILLISIITTISCSLLEVYLSLFLIDLCS